MADRGWELTPATRSNAALDTRAAKEKPDRAAMHAAWRIERRNSVALDNVCRALPDRSRTCGPAVSQVLVADCWNRLPVGGASGIIDASVFPERELVADVLGRLAGKVRPCRGAGRASPAFVSRTTGIWCRRNSAIAGRL